MGSSGEVLCLRWEDFGTHFSSSFRELRRQNSRDSFFDVSLAVGDSDQVVQAHRVILSACSPFFRNVLARQARASTLGGGGGAILHPVIFLRGVSARELRNVLDFMYHGEVNVAQDDLNAFLAVAEDLKVMGLTQAGDESKPKPEGGGGGGKRSAPAPPSGATPRKRQNVQHQQQQQQQQQQQHSSSSAPRQRSNDNDDNDDDEDDDDVHVIKSEPTAVSVPASAPSSSSGPHQAVSIDPPPDEDAMGYEDGGGGAADDYGEGDDYVDYGAEGEEESGDIVYEDDGGGGGGGREGGDQLVAGDASGSAESAKGRGAGR